MCFELCGPPLNGDPVEDAAYEAWLDSLDNDGDNQVGSLGVGTEEVSSESDETEDEEESNTIHEREALERFDEFLDEIHPTVTVCGYNYDPARALKELDPTAYREEFNNWLDSEGLELE